MENILHLLRFDQPRRSLGRRAPHSGKPEAFRYVLRHSRNCCTRKSERKSGSTRKGNSPSTAGQ
jgi:hypothetical protein